MPTYAEHQQNLKAAQLEVKKLQAGNRMAGNVRAGAAGAKKKKRKSGISLSVTLVYDSDVQSGRNLKLMRAVVLSVEFGSHLRKFRVPWYVRLSPDTSPKLNLVQVLHVW